MKLIYSANIVWRKTAPAAQAPWKTANGASVTAAQPSAIFP